MIKKNKRSTSYINHPLNNSPTKTAVKFGHQPRFVQKKIFSPDKFYDLPEAKEGRAASFGFGNKVDFTQEYLGQPAKYHLRTEFDQISQGYRFGVRPPMRELPKELLNDKSASPLKKTTSTLYDKTLIQNSPSAKNKTTPQTSSKRPKQEQRPALQSNQTVQNVEQPKQKKSAYRLKYEYSNSYLLDNKKSSYMDFIREKKPSPPKQNVPTFGLDQRWKRENSFKKVGPGSYNRFSQFGENQNAY